MTQEKKPSLPPQVTNIPPVHEKRSGGHVSGKPAPVKPTIVTDDPNTIQRRPGRTQSNDS